MALFSPRPLAPPAVAVPVAVSLAVLLGPVTEVLLPPTGLLVSTKEPLEVLVFEDPDELVLFTMEMMVLLDPSKRILVDGGAVVTVVLLLLLVLVLVTVN